MIRNGVKVARVDRRSIDSNKFEISMLGTLSFHKGQHLAIQCMKKLVQDHKNISLNIIGKGSIQSDLSNMLQEHGLSKNHVRILGRRDDAFEIIANSNLFWHLSMSEGMPLAVIEAMALGLPIIGFDVEGVRDVIINNENGYLVDYEDLDALASKTKDLILNEKLRKGMQEKSINEFNSKYTKGKMVLSYKEFLQNLL
jgi:glycosyltransferase involved in cell wall biosynthesis